MSMTMIPTRGRSWRSRTTMMTGWTRTKSEKILHFHYWTCVDWNTLRSEMGKSAIFRLKSSHTKIDWLGSQITYENSKRLSTYPNSVFISRYIYSAKIILDVGYVFLLHFQSRKQNWSA
jgi:hypothetical protein